MSTTSTGCRFVEALERRQLLSASVALVNGNLTITGDGGNDVITGATSRYTCAILVNGVFHKFAATDVKGVKIDTGGGNDVVWLGGAFWCPTAIQLGAGNDFAFGSGRGDVIRGGDGNDTINASGGHDTVYGDAGNDELEGGEASDTVYGGTGDDLLAGWDGYNLLYGQEGNDTIYATTMGKGVADGGGGYDKLYVPSSVKPLWSVKSIEKVFYR